MPYTGGKRSPITRLAWSAHIARRAPFEARFPFRSPERIERAQGRRLRATIDHAYEHVPFYGETMRRLGLGPGDFRTAADLARLPLIDRERVQRDPEYFLSRAEPRDSYAELRSGGSSGDPLSLLYHPFSLFEQAVYSERVQAIISKLAGRRRYREARVANVPGSPSGGPNVDTAFRKLSLIPPSIRVQRRNHSAVAPLEQLIDEIDAFRPDVIGSFGSFHEMLFAHLLRTGRDMHLPKVATYAGDSMSLQAREMINRRFGVSVLSVYTASEAFQIGFECEWHSGHHLNLDLFPVRIVSPEGRELPEGESGEVVVSNLQARGTVLLNYKLNDVARKLPGSCACGRNLPLLSWVQGRSDEWLEDSEGRRIHSQSVRGFLQNELEVLRFQVVQESRTLFRAALVTVPGADRDAISDRLQARFRETFGEPSRLEVSFVDSLPRTPAGKVRPVISLQA
jgi:phenylacetate-CoA ligase